MRRGLCVKRTMNWTTIAYGLTLMIAVPAVASASDSQAERASLTGLTELAAVVDDFASTAGKTGLKAAVFQQDAEDRLRKGGMRLKPSLLVRVADPRRKLIDVLRHTPENPLGMGGGGAACEAALVQ